jgi:hypothetical protein
MAIDLQELLLGEQASNLAAMARSHTNVMDLQQRVSLDKWASTDLLDAAAAKEIAKSGMASDLASLRAGVITPPIPAANG